MNKVIILKGRAAIGKSYTLFALIEKLTAIYGTKILYSSDGENNFWIKKRDGFVIIEIPKNTCEGNRIVRVGVLTLGDPGCEVAANDFRNLCSQKQYNVDILVAATRTKNIPGSIYSDTIKFALDNNAELIELSPIVLVSYSPEKNDALRNKIQTTCAEAIKSIILF